MKLAKKWMVVPFEEKKLETVQEKIQKIFKNKSLNKETKLKLINQIRDKNVPRAKEILRNDKKNSEKDSNNDNLHTRPEEKIDNTPDPLDDNFEDDNLIDISNDEFHDANDTTLRQNTTFKHEYDRLIPAHQTRSKSDIDRSFLDLEKQKEYTENKKKLKIKRDQKKKRAKILKARRKLNSISDTTPEAAEEILNNITPQRPINKDAIKDLKWEVYRGAKIKKPMFKNDQN